MKKPTLGDWIIVNDTFTGRFEASQVGAYDATVRVFSNATDAVSHARKHVEDGQRVLLEEL